MEKKEDKRIVRTKNTIKNTLIELLSKKELDKISITELTNKCQINRATFYLHYYSIYEVLDDIENSLVNALMNKTKKYDIVSLCNNPYPFLLSVTEVLTEKKELTNLLLFSETGHKLMSKIKNNFETYIYKEQVKQFNYVTPLLIDQTKIACSFIVSGIIDSYSKWYKTEPKTLSLENLCKGISELATKGLNSLS